MHTVISHLVVLPEKVKKGPPEHAQILSESAALPAAAERKKMGQCDSPQQGRSCCLLWQ